MSREIHARIVKAYLWSMRPDDDEVWLFNGTALSLNLFDGTGEVAIESFNEDGLDRFLELRDDPNSKVRVRLAFLMEEYQPDRETMGICYILPPRLEALRDTSYYTFDHDIEWFELELKRVKRKATT